MGLTYEGAGVSLRAADAWVERLKGLLGGRPSQRRNVISGIGGFAGLYDLGNGKALAACCDGVGTKLELAKRLGILRGLGQDLVAMNVNDLVTCGARPLFFLDYVACGSLDVEALSPILESIVESCEESGCILLGGETAEMPWVYPPQGFDLAGFAVGIVDMDQIVTGGNIEEGDLLLGLRSSGIHSNGYSLVRLAVERARLDLTQPQPGFQLPLGEELLRPTKLYVRAAMEALSTRKVKGMAHITGGGLEGNVSRIIPRGLRAQVDYSSWGRPLIFRLLQELGIEEEEMRRVFNLGIGFVLVASPDHLPEVADALARCGEELIVIGRVSGA